MKQKPKTRIKICGIRTSEEIELAARYGADAVGFITEVPVESPRNLDFDTAYSLVSEVPRCLDSVLVIMPEDSARGLELIEKVRPDIVQIHSKLPLSELELIKEKTNIPIIKTLYVAERDETSVEKFENSTLVFDLLEQVSLLEETAVVDAILLDTDKSGKPGGTGCVHDWILSRRIVDETRLPIILAGGLKPENVQEAIKAVSPYAVDTASGVEASGKKNSLKIKSFIKEVRCANAFL